MTAAERERDAMGWVGGRPVWVVLRAAMSRRCSPESAS